MANTTDATAVLNHLIETAQDGADGYRAASEDVKDAALKQTFARLAAERAQYVRELQPLVAAQGDAPRDSGSAIAAVHRGWINLKSVVTGRDDAAILAECQRGDENAVKTYDEAVGAALPAAALEVVRRQATRVRADYEMVRALKVAAS